MRASRAVFSVLFALNTIFAAHAQDLPVKDASEDLEAEAKKLMEDLPRLDSEGVVEPILTDPSKMTVEEAKAALDRAREKQQRWEKLARKGVLSRAEAESCAVEVADALARHERARVTRLKADLAALEERQTRGEASPDLVESARKSLQTAVELSASADQQARQTRIANARTNVERHRKLFAAGLISRIQMQKAEAALQKVEADGTDETLAGK